MDWYPKLISCPNTRSLFLFHFPIFSLSLSLSLCSRMRPVQKSVCALMVLIASLAFLYLHVWSPKHYSMVDMRHRPDQLPRLLLPDHLLVPDKKYMHIAFRIKEEILQ